MAPKREPNPRGMRGRTNAMLSRRLAVVERENALLRDDNRRLRYEVRALRKVNGQLLGGEIRSPWVALPFYGYVS